MGTKYSKSQKNPGVIPRPGQSLKVERGEGRGRDRTKGEERLRHVCRGNGRLWLYRTPNVDFLAIFQNLARNIYTRITKRTT